MKTLKLALSALLAAGLSAALPTAARAQYPGQPYGGQNSALAEARKQLKEAEMHVARVRKDMNNIRAKVAQKFEGKEEWETAQKQLKAAEAAHEQARKRGLAKLYASPEYKAAKDKQLKSEQAIQAAQGGKTSDKALDKAHQDRLEAGLALRKLETEALQAEPSIAQAKDKLEEARKTWEALQDELKEALEQDPDYLAAQTELETAQAQVDQMKQSMAQQAASERQARRAQQDAQRQTGGRGYGGGGAGYGGGRR